MSQLLGFADTLYSKKSQIIKRRIILAICETGSNCRYVHKIFMLDVPSPNTSELDALTGKAGAKSEEAAANQQRYRADQAKPARVHPFAAACCQHGRAPPTTTTPPPHSPSFPTPSSPQPAVSSAETRFLQHVGKVRPAHCARLRLRKDSSNQERNGA